MTNTETRDMLTKIEANMRGIWNLAPAQMYKDTVRAWSVLRGQCEDYDGTLDKLPAILKMSAAFAARYKKQS